VIANYDHGLEGVALAELFDGNGSALVSGFDLVSRSGSDPVADRMLGNLVRYMASRDAHQVREVARDKIVWGDYASERGAVTGVYSGMLVNTVPVVPTDLVNTYKLSVDKDGFWFAGGTSGWNTKPAIQYVAKGRRAYGPYTYTSGGSVQIDKSSTGRAKDESSFVLRRSLDDGDDDPEPGNGSLRDRASRQRRRSEGQRAGQSDHQGGVVDQGRRSGDRIQGGSPVGDSRNGVQVEGRKSRFLAALGTTSSVVVPSEVEGPALLSST
jgi:hypothetical protein